MSTDRLSWQSIAWAFVLGGLLLWLLLYGLRD